MSKNRNWIFLATLILNASIIFINPILGSYNGVFEVNREKTTILEPSTQVKTKLLTFQIKNDTINSDETWSGNILVTKSITLKGISGSMKLISLIKTYFDYLGFQLQFNVVDTKMLRDAQMNPDKYRDLIVRVAGFSAFFVELSKSIQDQVIERTELIL